MRREGGGELWMDENIQDKKTGELEGKNTENQRERDSRRSENGVGLRGKQIFENRIEREWLSTEEAAYFLSVSSNALRIMAHRGQIRTYKVGRRLRFSIRDCRSLFAKKGA